MMMLMLTMMSQMQIVDLMMKLYDKDGDGYLSKEEFIELANASGRTLSL